MQNMEQGSGDSFKTIDLRIKIFGNPGPYFRHIDKSETNKNKLKGSQILLHTKNKTMNQQQILCYSSR